MPRASGLEVELVDSCKADVELVAGSSGVYDIEVEGKLIFSKKELGRFPDGGEIVRLIQDL